MQHGLLVPSRSRLQDKLCQLWPGTCRFCLCVTRLIRLMVVQANRTRFVYCHVKVARQPALLEDTGT